jgi:hypothetical protein
MKQMISFEGSVFNGEVLSVRGRRKNESNNNKRGKCFNGFMGLWRAYESLSASKEDTHLNDTKCPLEHQNAESNAP